MVLKRKGNLPVLDRRRTQDEETANSNIFDHYESPCDFAVSNDPLEGDQDACGTRLVGCVRDHAFLPNTREQTTEMRLQYEYDLYYKADGSDYDFYDMLGFLEGAILDHLASPAVLDKEQCSVMYDERRRRDLKRYLQVFGDEIKKSIVAISSEKTDMLNREYECVTPPAEGITCQPMSGHATVYFERARLNATAEDQLMQGVLKAIETGMTSDTYVKGDVQRLTYIGSSREGATATPVPVAASQEQGSENERGGGTLGNTEISLVSTAAFLFVIIAVVGLFVIPKRRRKGQCGSESPIAVAENEFDVDEETAASNGARSWHNTTAGPVPTSLTRQQSLQSVEGSEIPGSLASVDALALKPQFPRHVSEGTPASAGKPPLHPPTRTYAHRDNISVSAALEAIKTDESLSATFTDTLRLSPIQNQNSGLSPSQVSPKRSGRIHTTTPSSRSVEEDEHSSVEQMVAEIESGVPLSQNKTPRKGSYDIETLNKIVASGSESDSSFRDSESGASPYQHTSRGGSRGGSSLDIR